MIPRTIHQIWVGSPLPDRFEGNCHSWRTLHPEWEWRLWTDSDLNWLVNRRLYDSAPRLVPADAIGQFRSDLARYEILHRFGGLYVDCDTIALRPIDDELADHSAWAAAEDSHWIGNTYVAAEAEHPALAALIAGIPASVARHRGKRPNKMCGPQYLTPIWREFGCAEGPRELFYPYSYSNVKNGTVPTDFGAAIAVHQWQHTRDVIEARTR